jgi:hypothetical protein
MTHTNTHVHAASEELSGRLRISASRRPIPARQTRSPPRCSPRFRFTSHACRNLRYALPCDLPVLASGFSNCSCFAMLLPCPAGQPLNEMHTRTRQITGLTGSKTPNGQINVTNVSPSNDDVIKSSGVWTRLSGSLEISLQTGDNHPMQAGQPYVFSVQLTNDFSDQVLSPCVAHQ